MKNKTKPKEKKGGGSNGTEKSKKKYRVRNRKEYNEAPVNRGRIVFHITEEALKQRESDEREKKKKPGRPKKFSVPLSRPLSPWDKRSVFRFGERKEFFRKYSPNSDPHAMLPIIPPSRFGEKRFPFPSNFARLGNAFILSRIRSEEATQGVEANDSETEKTNEKNSEQAFSVAILNGTETTGLAKKTGEKVKETFALATLTKTMDATKKDYVKTIVSDVSGKFPNEAQRLAELLNGQVGALPEGETAPEEVDILVVVGSNESD